MPRTFRRSSIARNRPRCARSARIASARLAPMPGRRRRSASPATLRATGSSGVAWALGGTGAGVGDGAGALGGVAEGAVVVAGAGEAVAAGARPGSSMSGTAVVPLPATAVRPMTARIKRPDTASAACAAGFANRDPTMRLTARAALPRNPTRESRSMACRAPAQTSGSAEDKGFARKRGASWRSGRRSCGSCQSRT